MQGDIAFHGAPKTSYIASTIVQGSSFKHHLLVLSTNAESKMHLFELSFPGAESCLTKTYLTSRTAASIAFATWAAFEGFTKDSSVNFLAGDHGSNRNTHSRKWTREQIVACTRGISP